MRIRGHQHGIRRAADRAAGGVAQSVRGARERRCRITQHAIEEAVARSAYAESGNGHAGVAMGRNYGKCGRGAALPDKRGHQFRALHRA